MSGDYKTGDYLRGVVRCESCLWYIGKKMLRGTNSICPICDADAKEAA